VIRDDVTKLFDLTDRVAIITGGSRGIGRALADGFAACGAKVVIASRKAESCDQAVTELTAQGADALAVATHMGDLDAVRALVDRTVEHFGGVDIVVNNAANPLGIPIADITDAAWQKSYAVNLQGPVMLAQAALPYLTESEHASILNVISVGALIFSPGTAMYAGAKAALLAYTRNMAAEWVSRGIRVNALAPGTVDTDMVRNTGPESAARMAKISLQGRAADPREMIGPALFLVSDAASYVTGQMVVADGGFAVAR
jgi:NAD(P)-dependent dehydrogenase (short-subunit alcohol dehydrogenase family)